MAMNKDKRFIFNYFCTLVVLAVATWAVFRRVLPEQKPQLLWIVPVFFAIMPCLLQLTRRLLSKMKSGQTMFYLAYRMVKLLLSAILLIVYFINAAAGKLQFAIVFVCFYLVLTVVETLFFIKKERN